MCLQADETSGYSAGEKGPGEANAASRRDAQLVFRPLSSRRVDGTAICSREIAYAVQWLINQESSDGPDVYFSKSCVKERCTANFVTRCGVGGGGIQIFFRVSAEHASWSPPKKIEHAENRVQLTFWASLTRSEYFRRKGDAMRFSASLWKKATLIWAERK